MKYALTEKHCITLITGALLHHVWRYRMEPRFQSMIVLDLCG